MGEGYDHPHMASGDTTTNRTNFLHVSHILVRLAFGISILVLGGAALAGIMTGRARIREDSAVLADHALSRQSLVTLICLQSFETAQHHPGDGRRVAIARNRLNAAVSQLLKLTQSSIWQKEIAGLAAIAGPPVPSAATGLPEVQILSVRRDLLNFQLQVQQELTARAQQEKDRAIFLSTMLTVLSLLSGALLAGAWIYVRERLTNEQRTQRELEQLQQRHVLILNSIGEAICGVDRQGMITFVNPAASSITGWKLDDLLGRNLIDFLHARSFQTVTPTSAVLDSLRDGTVQRVSIEVFEQPDGGLIPIEYISTPLWEGDVINGAVVAFQDITERRRIERMKGEFMAVVSHELRTPLTSLRGALGLLGSGRMGQIPEPGSRMLSIALSNAERLGRLVNDILDLERLNAGRFQLDRKMHNLSGVMQQALDVVRPVADRANVQMLSKLAEIQVWIDSDRILQTMINLLGNAVKFSPAGSTVWLETTVQESFAIVSVRDQGRGIPTDKLDAVFEQFEQVDASDSREKGGTGLGLPICRGIVQQHGGRIWVESILGRGSTFSFTLPLVPETLGKAMSEMNDAESAAASQSV